MKYKKEREKLDKRRKELIESLNRKYSGDNCHDFTKDEERELRNVMGKIEAYNGIIRDQRNDIISDLKGVLIGLGLSDYLGTVYDYINSEKAFW